MFSQPRRHAAILRFSTTPGDQLSDNVSTPRGMALKIIDVDGERLPGASEERSQDFIMVNGPVFNAPHAESFLRALQMLAVTTDRFEGFKKILSAALRGIETAVESVGGESSAIKSLGGEPRRHILGNTFFTQLPLRYGDYIAKLSLAPASANLTVLSDKLLESSSSDAIRESVRSFFAAETAEWQLRVQLCTNFSEMPSEQANVKWDEAKSPYLPVATLRASRQDTWSHDRATTLEDSIAFSPRHGIAAHWPLGSLNRIRQHVYENSQRFRSERNKCPVREPKSAA